MTRRSLRAGGLRIAGLPVAGLLSLLAGPPATARAASLADGQIAYDAGRFAAARDIWSGLAAGGDAQAAFGLGTLYELGAGVPADPATAYCWYRRAAEGGNPKAAFNVAVMHDSGRGAPHDAAAAASWYARAAAAGFARAQFNLGQLYEAGEGVPRNAQVAAGWYRLAAAGGLSAAADRLAGLHLTARSNPAALPLAVRLDDPAAGVALAGFGTAADQPSQAVPLVWQAVAQAVTVSYYVEVVAASEDPPRLVFSVATPVSAVLASLPPGHYAGRVYSVAADASHYAIGGWTRFSVGGAEPPPACGAHQTL